MSENETSIPAAPDAPERGDEGADETSATAATPSAEEQAADLLDSHPPHDPRAEAEASAEADADDAQDSAEPQVAAEPTEDELNARVDAARAQVDAARQAVADAESFLKRQSDALDVTILARERAQAKEPPQKAITDYIASQNRIRAAKGKRRQELAESGVLELMETAAPAKIDRVRQRATGFGNTPKPTPRLGGN